MGNQTMNIKETTQLLQEISAVDKRHIEPGTVQIWQSILANIPLEIAREAHKLARRDANINYLEPRHIVQWSREAAYKLDREEKRNQPEEVKRGDPEPICKAHGKRVTTCEICTRRIYEMSHLHDAALLLWAKEHVYG